MLLSEHIAKAVELLAEEGDLPVFYEHVDPYTGVGSEEEPALRVVEEYRERRRDGTEEVTPRRVLVRY